MRPATRTLLLTGPAAPAAARPWIAAGESAGWDVEHRALVKTGIVPIDPARVSLLPACVAVTSANAIPALARLWQARPDLRLVPHAAIGTATARQLDKRGVAPEILATGKGAGAEELAWAIGRSVERGHRVFWPRSDRAHELRDHLVAQGLVVEDPVAYRTVPVEGFEPPDRFDLAFFASPSAVEAWCALTGAPRGPALAIGPTTYGALTERYARFSALHRLDHPTPDALRNYLSTRLA